MKESGATGQQNDGRQHWSSETRARRAYFAPNICNSKAVFTAEVFDLFFSFDWSVRTFNGFGGALAGIRFASV